MNRERDWNDAVRESLREAKTPTSDALWQSIEQTLEKRDAPATPPLKRYIWAAISTAAAVVIVALLLLPKQQEIAETIAMQSTSEIEATEKIEIIDIDKEVEVTDLVAIVREDLSSNILDSRDSAVNLIILENPTQPKESEKVLVDIAQQEQPKQGATENKSELATTPSSSYSSYLPEDLHLQREQRKNILSLQYAGGVNSNNSSASTSRSSMVNSVLASTYGAAEINFDDIYNSANISHHQPLGVGLKFQKELSNRLILASGINYTRLISDLDMVGSGKERQKIHFIGLPVILNYRFFSKNNFSLYLGAGGSTEYCVGAKIGGKSAQEHPWHFSADLNLGVEYSLNSWLGLYLEPTLSHYFTETNLRTIRNDSPTTFNIRLGISFSF